MSKLNELFSSSNVSSKSYSQTQKVFINSKPYFLRNRSIYSDVDAIKLISNFGISNIIDINDTFILEEFVNFEKCDLTLDEYIPLLKDIHSSSKGDLHLVHGDFSSFNTTKLNAKPSVFDYEHAHWGNIYRDLGRVILREIDSNQKSLEFLESYFEFVPNKKDLRNGIIAFCQWQNKIRLEKNVPYANVPLERAKRVLNSENNYMSILDNFRRPL